MKKIIALLLAVLMVVGMVACAAKTEAPAKEEAPAAEAKEEPKAEEPAKTEEEKKAEAVAESSVLQEGNKDYTPSDETLYLANKANPNGLCHLAVTAISANNAHMVSLYDCLVDYDYATNTVSPSLAESWEQIDDTHVRFHLRQGVKSHAGDPFTASDVIYTVTTGQEGGLLSNYYSMFNLAECKVEDDYTVVLATNNPEPFFMFTMANTPLSMVVQASVEKNGGLEGESLKPTAGTGPYKFVEWADGSYIKLERNEEYWDGPAYFKAAEIRIITEASARVMNLESGDVDIALDPDVNALAALKDNPDFSVVNLPTSNITTMYLNCSTEPFKDVNARRAVASALNYEANLKIAAGGYGTLTDTYLPVNNVMYVSPEKSFIKTDLDAAKAALAESAYPDGFTFELSYKEDPTMAAFAEMVQGQLGEIGITVNLAPLAAAEFDARISDGAFDAEMSNASNPDPAVQSRYYDGRIDFKTMRGGCGYTDGSQELLDLIDAAKVTIDETERKATYAKIQEILADVVPAIPVYSPNKLCATDADLVGMTLTEFCDVDWSKCYRVAN